jgi:hypothetical protein
MQELTEENPVEQKVSRDGWNTSLSEKAEKKLYNIISTCIYLHVGETGINIIRVESFTTNYNSK